MAKKKRPEKHTEALQHLGKLQKTLLVRLGDYVLENRESLARAAEGSEGYGFTLHQLDELFLSRLNLIERTIAELHKTPGPSGNRYRSMVFTASRDEVEQEINSRLEQVPSARILGVTVSPASASPREADQLDEIPPLREVLDDGLPDALTGGLADELTDGSEETDDDLLVTVLYYGPPVAPEA